MSRDRGRRGGGSCGRGFSPDAVRSAAASRPKSVGPEGPPTKASEASDPGPMPAQRCCNSRRRRAMAPSAARSSSWKTCSNWAAPPV
ncbi:DUF6053 domain-containing protein [Lysobacter enzymogenes]|uniref:DUF6053 domain-containing protein n=1 Tax=Lysobacter enzymogenes TaxID=69 RepID=UPI003CCDD28D